MTNILVIGASQANSIGTLIKNSLQNEKYQVILASRSGAMGLKCDITQPKSVERVIKKTRPAVVIAAAGSLGNPAPLGKIKTWDGVINNLNAKSFGSLVLLDAAVKFRIGTVIFLAGRKMTNEPSFAQFTVGNGAVWSAVQFAAKHTALQTFYISMGAINGTSMVDDFLDRHLSLDVATIDKLTAVIKRILNKKYQTGSRIKV